MTTIADIRKTGLHSKNRTRIQRLLRNVQNRILDEKAQNMDALEIDYMGKAAEAWVTWSNDVHVELTKSPNAPPTIRQGDLASYLCLDDDQFVLIDQAHAKLTPRMQQFVDVEFRHGGSTKQKCEQMGLERRIYGQRVNATLSFWYDLLRPHGIEQWREMIL